MIRHGRDVVDQRGVAALHHLPWPVTPDRRPWTFPDHPPPVNMRPGERPRRGRPTLWDRAQAEAFARGRRVPTLPHNDHPGDLLDAVEVAELRGMSLRQFNDARMDNRVHLDVAPPDAHPCGVAHWRRATAETMRLRVDEPNRHRPTLAESADRHRRLTETLAAMAADEVDSHGRPRNVSEFARRANVTRVTADRFLADNT